MMAPCFRFSSRAATHHWPGGAGDSTTCGIVNRTQQHVEEGGASIVVARDGPCVEQDSVAAKPLGLKGNEQHTDVATGGIAVIGGRSATIQEDNARIVATGKQASFSQEDDNTGEIIRGKANQMDYGINSARLELSGKASLVKGKNSFRNDKIIYDREKATVKAGISAKGKERVKITIGPKKN